MTQTSLVRQLPAIGRLLDSPALSGVIELYGREAVRVQAQREIDDIRRAILAAEAETKDSADHPELSQWTRRLENLPTAIADRISSRLRGIRRVINATGILVHTNLGRSPLTPSVLEEVLPLLTDYCDLEVDLESGRRGERNRRVKALLQQLCGAESAIVTNNNAAAMVLALSALAKGKEVVVSRGELVEIGGSFRIPDILQAAGARLREVGTTNRTHLRDYEQAIHEETALLLKVHPSNYRIRGFTNQVSARELVEPAKRHNIPLLIDEGSGLLRASSRPQLRDHTSLSELIADGCDLVCGSGDKLLGGPQAGLLLGRKDLIETCRRYPLYRALRPDRFTYAALQAVLRRHLVEAPMPLDRLWQDPHLLEKRLTRLWQSIGREHGRLVEVDGFIGGGSAPDAAVSGLGLAIFAADNDLAQRLRLGTSKHPPVVGYLQDGHLMIDLRTVDPKDDELVASAISVALAQTAQSQEPEP